MSKINHICSNSLSGKTVYMVELPEGVQIPDDELVTRCDNSTFDLDRPAGKECHFGGKVERKGRGATVTVWID